MSLAGIGFAMNLTLNLLPLILPLLPRLRIHPVGSPLLQSPHVTADGHNRSNNDQPVFLQALSEGPVSINSQDIPHGEQEIFPVRGPPEL